MRKFWIIICFIITFLIIYFLQVNLFSTLTINGIKPNLFIILVLFIGLYANQILGISFGIGIGLILDLLYGKTIGVTALMLCVVGYLGAYFDKNFSKENKFTIIFMVLGVTIIFELGNYFINSIILNFEREFWYFFKILFIECLYNVLLTIIIYPIMQKAGYIIDRSFKRSNILTRYF